MKKRISSFLIILAVLGSIISVSASEAIAPRASLYLDAYAIGVSAKGNGRMAVTYIVYGTNTMDCLGAQKIVVEEWTGLAWEESMTFSVSKNPSFYAYDVSEHAGTVYFYGLPGAQYRATLTAYAELEGGWDTGTVTCDPETCK